MGTNVNSILPEDIEARLAAVQEKISLLDGKIISTTNEVEAKKTELGDLNSKILAANAEYNSVVTNSENINKTLNERETKLAQKESALNVYANALEEKEKRITKYLNIFENMKDVVSK